MKNPAAWRQDSSLPPALGCMGCPDFIRCGGLRIRAAALDCTSFCDCENPARCDRACRLNPYFVKRVEEVGGLDLCALPASTNTKAPYINGYAPLIYHGSKRNVACESAIVAIPFFALFNRITGEPRFSDRVHLADSFKIDPEATIIASATAKDGPLERWWRLRQEKKILIYRNLRTIKIDLITGPNYSVFNNVPFWDNWHNQKRSALSWTEFMSEGVPCALHINAHTNEDYIEFLRLLMARRDLTALSVEFKTGMGHASRISWHANELARLALRTGRPLQLVMRGGKTILGEMRSAFSSVLFIDTEPFVKTQQRQRPYVSNHGALIWKFESTTHDEKLDFRLNEAIELSKKEIECAATTSPKPPPHRTSRLTHDRRQQPVDWSNSRQLSFTFSPSIKNQRTVTTPEPQKRS